MSNTNIPMNLFNRFFREKTYISSFTKDKEYSFSWIVSEYELLGIDGNEMNIVNIKVTIKQNNLKKNIFGYSHDKDIKFLIKKKLENVSGFLRLRINNIVII